MWRRCLIFVLALFGWLMFDRPSSAQEDDWIGVKVLERRPGVMLKAGKRLVGKMADLGATPLVLETQGEWLRVGSEARSGWVHLNDVVAIDEAVEYFTSVVKAEPKRGWGYNLRGIALQDQGRYDAALHDYTMAIRLNPRDAAAYNNRAWILATCPDDQAHRQPTGRRRGSDGLQALELQAADLSRYARRRLRGRRRFSIGLQLASQGDQALAGRRGISTRARASVWSCTPPASLTKARRATRFARWNRVPSSLNPPSRAPRRRARPSRARRPAPAAAGVERGTRRRDGPPGTIRPDARIVSARSGQPFRLSTQGVGGG